MALISPRVLMALATLLAAWMGVHVLTAHPASVVPAVWPSAASSPSPATTSSTPAGRSGSSPSASTATVPVLPDVLRRLNTDTGRTATGLYQLLHELEGAVASDVGSLVRRLEPGR